VLTLSLRITAARWVSMEAMRRAFRLANNEVLHCLVGIGTPGKSRSATGAGSRSPSGVAAE
jgi:hypothetical protein